MPALSGSCQKWQLFFLPGGADALGSNMSILKNKWLWLVVAVVAVYWFYSNSQSSQS
jgi:hypothetical protein